jgi:hypothetical protein
MTEQTELTALAAQRRGITGRTHTEEYDGQTIHITRWGTERTWVECDQEALLLLAYDKNGNGPIDLWVDTEHLRELHLVLSVYLDEYVKDQLGVMEVGA